MNVTSSHMPETLRQVQVFLDHNAVVVGPAIAPSRRNLDDVVTAITSHAATQETGSMSSREETARQRTFAPR